MKELHVKGIVHRDIKSENIFYKAFSVGLGMTFGLSVFINAGVVMGLLPTKGLTLPFMSYGGSHIIGESIGLGMILSMARYERASHPDDIHNEFLGFT